MKQHIKDRVDKINQGIVPEGYRDTSIGVFPEDWDVKKLGGLGEIHRGKGIPKSAITDSGFPCIIYGEIYTKYNNVISNLSSKINQDTTSSSFPLQYGDVLFTSSGETSEEIGKSVMYLNEETAYAGGDMVVLRPKDEVKNEVYGYLLNMNYIRKQKYEQGQGHSVVHLYGDNIKSILVPVIKKEEQQKIADILATWGQKIKLKELLIKEKEMQKKGLMQRIFIPNQSWDYKTMHELGEFHNGRTLAKKDILEEGKYKCILYGELFTTYKEVIHNVVSRTNLMKDNFMIGKAGDLLFPTSTTADAQSLIFPSSLKEDDVVLGGDMSVFRGDNNLVNSDYLSYYFNGPGKSELAKSAQGITIIHIYNSEIKKYEIILPPLPEQQRIANILSTADKEIELLKDEVSVLKEEKDGLMQLLLTGIIRVGEDNHA